jgi:hypothetical protein
MPLVMNALDEENKVVVGGNTFTFKPRQIKEIYQSDIAHIITRYKGEFGFVGLPDDLTYVVHLKPELLEKTISDEHKQIIEDARRAGVDAYVNRLRSLVYNAQVSLKRDLEQKNYKQDVRTEWTKGDVANLENLVKYQGRREDHEQKKFDKIKELEKQLEKSSKG